MQSISLIAVVDKHFGLGKDNQLLCYLPADLNHFKILTLGKAIIMGRKTFLSIGKPLPGRQNIVLSRQTQKISGVDMAASLTAAISLVPDHIDIMIIGGGNVFKQAMPLAHQIYLTVIEHQFSADVFFPIIDDTYWSCVSTDYRPFDSANMFDLTFYHYLRNQL